MMKAIAVVMLLLVTGIPVFSQRAAKVSEKKQPEVNKAAPAYILEMEGLLYLGNSKGKAQITVYKDSSIFLTTESDKRSGKCSFTLPLDQVFIIELSKEGYLSKKIKINTKVPELKKKKNFIFRFEADIFEDIPGLNVSVLKKPVAEVKYSDGFDSFIYDVDYTTRVNKDLKKLYQDYYLLQKAGMEGDSLVNPAVTKDQKKKSR